MAYLTREYPSWDSIKNEVSPLDLLDIIDKAIKSGDIDEAIKDYIEENYDYETVPDYDAAYEQMRDDRLTEGH